MASCVICSLTLKCGQIDFITCASCNILFHWKCVPLKREDTDQLKNGKKILSCKSCIGKLKSSEQTTPQPNPQLPCFLK